MISFEYLHRYFHHPFPESDLANLGSDGWEMIAFSERDALGNAWFYFKRVRAAPADSGGTGSVPSNPKPGRKKS